MTSFSIDDVRETLTGDVSRFLATIEATASELVDVCVPLGPSFRSIEDAGHAIYGTSSLVSAASLATSAHLLEDLAERGQRELALAAEHAERARRIAEAVRDGAVEMRSMLELELDHRCDDAQWLAMSWQEKAQGLLDAAHAAAAAARSVAPAAVASAEATVAPSGEEVADDGGSFSFSFDAEPTAGAQDGEEEDELFQIFQTEARECLVALQKHLGALVADPDDLVAAEALERLFHTLKGAAATVALEEATARAQALQQRMQGVVEGTQRVTAQLLESLVEDTRSLLSAAGLPRVDLTLTSPAARSAPPPVDELRAQFQAELEKVIAEAADWLVGPRTPERAAALGRIFHGIKGSALVVGEQAIADLAARVQELSGAPAPADDALAAGLQELAKLAGLAGDRTAAAREEPAVDEEALAVFRAEARQICDDVARRIETSDVSNDEALLGDLGALFHRLKGSALIVGDNAVHREAARVEEATTGSGGREFVANELPRAIGRLRQLLGEQSHRPRTLHARGAVERHEVASADPELWASFAQECAELLEALDKRALALEESAAPREELRAVLPLLHTLKGVVNTMGLSATGKLLHRTEDVVEDLAARTALPSLRNVASFLIDAHADVRRNLRQARDGYVEVSFERLERRIANIVGSGAEVADASSMSNDASEVSRSGASHGTHGTGAVDRKFVRVDTTRLDALMNLAGELVISRSRLRSRFQVLRSMQAELQRGSLRLVETVERFTEEHEFARLDGRSHAHAQPLALAAGAESMARDAAWTAFGELELDRYEDVHILSRSLTELTSDFGEMYGQLSAGLSALNDDADDFSGIVSGIQSEVTRARMIPVESLFTRLRLPIREAALAEGKEVRVVTRGEDVLIDRVIADALFLPMLHLVRNAVAHGIESPAQRESRGKSGTGTIELVARQEMGHVALEVRDDGAGLNLAKLRAEGIAMGLITSDVSEDDAAVRDLVFASGLSTEPLARAVAGRGVGCDVVRRGVERLSGTVTVHTERGVHSTFVLTLPLTLAITKALVVREGGHTFAVPLHFAERILAAEDAEIVTSAGVSRVHFDGQWVPVERLGTLLGLPTSTTGPVLVLRVGATRALIRVEELVAHEEIVVKSLGALLTGHPFFAGVTARGTGAMALILDVPAIVEAEHAARAASPRAEPRGPTAPDSAPPSGPRAVSEPTESVTPPVETSEGATRRPRVMFVDDSLSVRKVAEKALASLGVDVTIAIDGLDALEKIRSASFDLVFTDLEMPRMHGFELIRELRFLKAHRDLPIVVVTSRSGQKHQDQARALGANEYITKPFTVQSLSAAIDAWARPRAARDASGSTKEST
jgi:chemosensory pili system protein ChpA (sensor histidine kinase/response regulator)